MVQAFSQQIPLSEGPTPYDAAQDMQGLLSPDPGVRTKAADSLKKYGDQRVAQSIESLLLSRNLAPEVRSDARNVLLVLSDRYREYLLDTAARVRRTKAISIPAITRTKTPPRGIPAIRH